MLDPSSLVSNAAFACGGPWNLGAGHQRAFGRIPCGPRQVEAPWTSPMQTKLTCFVPALFGLILGLRAPLSRKRLLRRPVAKRSAAGGGAQWQQGVQESQEFASEEDYLAYMEERAGLPEGFRAGSVSLTFQPAEVKNVNAKMNLSVISLEEPTDHYAAVFTSNAFPGSPVRVGRRRLAAGKPLQAIVVNNKISNVLPGGDGQQASETVCAATAEMIHAAGGAESVLPCSTGIIGWRLPTDDMVAALPRVAPSLQMDSIMPVARGIMTTDRYPKVASRELPGGARIVGIAKGAGMIEPNMATMLGFILTDADLPCERAELQEALASAASRSFNCVSIDGDESTSDTLALLASRRRPCTSMDNFRESLDAVCRDLAAQVVRNGEGTRHVIRVAVSGAEDEAMARRVGHAVVNGPLFKSAVAGNDPNVGRLVGKVGQSLGRAGAQLADGCVCSIGGEVIFEKGRFTLDQAKEERLSAHLRAAVQDTGLAYPQHHRVVDVQVKLGGGGQGAAVVLGSDLTDEYVSINADYRS